MISKLHIVSLRLATRCPSAIQCRWRVIKASQWRPWRFVNNAARWLTRRSHPMQRRRCVFPRVSSVWPASAAASCSCKLCRRHVVQRTVWTLLIVILPPSFDLSSCITHTGEPVRVQTFIPQPAVEAFYVRVLYGLSRLNKLQSHSAVFAPGRGPTAKPRPVVQNDGFRQSPLARNPIQHAAHS